MAVQFSSSLGAVLTATGQSLARAAEIIGGMAESHAKQYLTEKHAVDTGNLRNSVTHTITEEDGNVVVVIGSAVHYAPYIELGTGRQYEGSGGHGVIKGMAPRPYLRPAIENHKNEYKEVLQNELKS